MDSKLKLNLPLFEHRSSLLRNRINNEKMEMETLLGIQEFDSRVKHQSGEHYMCILLNAIRV
jgi:hypothetical protein